jgi:hypothetical protein
MTKGSPRIAQRGIPQRQEVIKQTFALKAAPITVNGATGIGFGSAVIGDFPEGNILFLGAVSYLQLTTVAASGIIATYDGDYSIGTVPTANADLSGAGEADIVPSTALGAATAKVSPLVRGTQSSGALAGVVLDNTDNSLELNLNLLIDDASISADGIAFTADGSVTILYSVLGDD